MWMQKVMLIDLVKIEKQIGLILFAFLNNQFNTDVAVEKIANIFRNI